MDLVQLGPEGGPRWEHQHFVHAAIAVEVAHRVVPVLIPEGSVPGSTIRIDPAVSGTAAAVQVLPTRRTYICTVVRLGHLYTIYWSSAL